MADYSESFYNIVYMLIFLVGTMFQNGLVSSLPFIGRFIGSVGSGMLADNLMTRELLSVTAARKIFHVSGPFLTIVFISSLPSSHKNSFASYRKNIYLDVKVSYFSVLYLL